MSKRLSAMLFGSGLGIVVVVAASSWLLFRLNTLSQLDSQVQNSEPVVVVNGVAISQMMIDREMQVSRFNLVDPLPPLHGDDLERAQAEALNQLITRQLILQAALQQGFTLSAETIQQRVDLLFGGYGPEKLEQGLAQANLTRADLTWWVAELATVEAFTVEVIMANTSPDTRQQVYNDWLNQQQAAAHIETVAPLAEGNFTALPGHPAPNFTLSTSDDQTISLTDYQGRVVLINFWATWCPSCIAEMPAYEAVYQQQADRLVVLGINLQESSEQVQKFAASLGLSFPILLDQDGQVTIEQYQMVGMPGSIIVDRDGIIFYRHIGPMSSELLQQKLAQLP